MAKISQNYVMDFIIMENRRRYPRYEIEFEARLYAEDINLTVSVIDISEGGIGIISEKPIEIGVKVFISLFPLSEDPLIGTPVWSTDIEKGNIHLHICCRTTCFTITSTPSTRLCIP